MQIMWLLLLRCSKENCFMGYSNTQHFNLQTYRVTVKGYELEADPMCGSERLNVLGQPVGFILKSPSSEY